MDRISVAWGVATWGSSTVAWGVATVEGVTFAVLVGRLRRRLRRRRMQPPPIVQQRWRSGREGERQVLSSLCLNLQFGSIVLSIVSVSVFKLLSSWIVGRNGV